MLFIVIFYLSCLSVSAVTLSFNDLVKIGLRQNYGIKTQENLSKKSKWDYLLKTRDFYLPKLTMKITATDQDYYEGSFTNNKNRQDNSTIYRGRTQLDYNIFNGFYDLYSYREMKHQFNLSKDNLRGEKQQFVYNLKLLYLEISQEYNRLKIVEEELSRNQKLLKASKLRYKKGRLAKVDYERSEIEFLDSKSNLLTIQNRIDKLKMDMASLLHQNHPIKKSIELFKINELEKDHINLVERLEKLGVSAIVEEFLREYIQDGNDRKKLENIKLVQESSKLKANAGYFPKVSLVASHDYSFNTSITNHEKSENDFYEVYLALSIPIFDSFDTFVNSKKEQLDLVNTEYQIKRSEIESENLIRKYCLEFKSKHKDFELAKARLKLRKRIYESTSKRFNVGAVTIKDLIDDKIDFTRESFNLAKINYELRTLYLKLEKVSGRINEYLRGI